MIDLKFNNDGMCRICFDNGYGVNVSLRSNLNREARDEQQYSISILKGEYIDMENPLTPELVDYKTMGDIERVIDVVRKYENVK